jgi:hypothetical protein
MQMYKNFRSVPKKGDNIFPLTRSFAILSTFAGMLFRIITWAIVIGLLYRFLVRFIFPVVHITKSAYDKIRQMQEQMEKMQQPSNPQPHNEQIKDGDYIDYEEVK